MSRLRIARLFLLALCIATTAGAAPSSGLVVAFTAFDKSGRFALGVAATSADGRVVVGFDLRKLPELPDYFTGDCCPSWSPDGSRIAFSGDRDPKLSHGIYVMKADGSDVHRLTSGAGNTDRTPQWSPDGAHIAFVRELGSGFSVWVMNADGTKQSKVGAASSQAVPDWSPDGRQIVWEPGPDGPFGVNLHDLASSTTRLVFRGIARRPRWSPDGRRIAFAAEGLWVVNADGSGLKRLTKTAADDPDWSPDGSRIVFTGTRPTGEYGRMGPIVRYDLYDIAAAGGDERRLTGALDDVSMNIAGGTSGTYWPDGSRVFFTTARTGSLYEPEYTTYVMDADGACEQRFASTELLIVSPVWKPGATPSLPAPRCVDPRLTSTAPALIGIKHDAYVSVTVENDGNMPAVGLRLLVASKGPARVGPVAGECVRASGGSCELAPIAAGTQRVVSYRVNAPRSGNEAIRVEIAPAEPDPDQSSGRLDIAISIVPCTTLGSDGDDTMFGSKGTDRICALGGRDRVEAFKGDDYVDGGSSADFIDGGAGRDRLIGGGGPDVIVADDGERDTISCGWGNDVVVADRIDKVANDCEKVARPVR